MSDGIEVVEQNPAPLALAGQAARDQPVVLEPLANMLGDRAALSLVRSRADDEEVGEPASLTQIEDDDVGRKLVAGERGDAPGELERAQGPSQVGSMPEEGTRCPASASR